MQKKVLVLGAGKVGALVAALLGSSDNYEILLADQHIDSPRLKKIRCLLPTMHCFRLDVTDELSLSDFIRTHQVNAIVSNLPYFHVLNIAKVAKACGNIDYFDLTEDLKTAQAIIHLAKDSQQVFATQCGLAPGFVSIVAAHLIKQFDELETVKMRVGALPINVSNALQYSITWSTDGLINEYVSLCRAIIDGRLVTLNPLEGLEAIKLDGLTYEAFNTSGGAGSLLDSYIGKVKTMNYKTIRYPGHCEKILFLLNDLKLKEKRKELKILLESGLPKTCQDVVLVYVSVTGKSQGVFLEKNYVEKFYPKTICGLFWSSIQVTTAANICATVDLVLQHPHVYHGHFKQESIELEAFLSSHFGQYYKTPCLHLP